MAFAIVPILMQMRRDQLLEAENRRLRNALHPPAPERCWRPQGTRQDFRAVEWPSVPVTSIRHAAYPCGCVEYFLKWTIPDGMIGYRHTEKECGLAPMELG